MNQTTVRPAAIIALLAIGTTLLGCTKPTVLPIQPHTPLTAAEDAPGSNEPDGAEVSRAEPVGPSALLTLEEVSVVASALMGNCRRASIVTLPTREILIGYGEDGPGLVAMVSLTLIGQEDGTIVLAVGVDQQNQRPRITRAMTLKPRGDFYGLATYLHEQASFLEQFTGREEGESVDDVDAITGATSVCDTLRDTISAEAHTLAGYFLDPVHLDNLVTDSLPISLSQSPPAE